MHGITKNKLVDNVAEEGCMYGA